MLPLLPLALSAGANYLSGKRQEDAQERSDAANNARSLREYQANMQEQFANQAAQNEYLSAMSAAGEAGLSGRLDAFQLMKDADDEETKARENLAAAIKGFGKTSKEAHLAAAKAKRSGRVAKAVKGTKVKGTSGAGRKGIRGAIKSAQSTGLSRASDTSSMAAGLGSYGADLAREMGVYGDLAAENSALGQFAKYGRRTAEGRERLANQDASTMRSVAGMNKANQVYANRYLGAQFLPFDPQVRIDPNNSGLNAFSTLMGGMAGYGGGNPFGKTDQGAFNMDGSPYTPPPPPPPPPAYYGSKAYPYGGY